ncbi:MAG: hypothetical protein GEV07_15805 [Streptosporangiales bacterium]|nr:hypothetical protein [Streptosporangiales bacterium]
MLRHVVRIRLLGPPALEVAGREVELRGHRERALLAALALRIGEVVSTTSLADVIWGPTPPPTAGVQIQSCVSTLRKRLAAADVAEPRNVLVTRQPGYLLPTNLVTTDLDEFRQHVHLASVAARRGDHEHAHECYLRGLALWRGQPFQDIGAPEFDVTAERLREEWLCAVEGRMDAALQLDSAHDLVGTLTDLVRTHPLRERLRGQLMLALYRTGRQAEALDVYTTGRRQLVDELGLDPGEQLQRLQQRIVTGDPTLLQAGADSTARTGFQAALPTPRQLPADLGSFVGRRSQLDELLAVLTDADRGAAPALICLHGGGGTGKTALAVHAAHRATGEFPDGQLYAHLGGGAGAPVAAFEVLGTFLHAFGVTGADLPSNLDERVALFRSCLAGRRVLVLLDDAADAAQVRPLLPATADCAAIVTSRPILTSLDGAHQLPISTLADGEARQLLAEHLGGDQLAAAGEAVDQLVELCGRLPLALRVTAARLTKAGGAPPIDRFARRLADERHRLDLLQSDDLAVRATLLLSWESLGDDQRLLVQRLALLPPLPFPDWMPAPLLDVDEDTGRDLLDDLAGAHLVEHAGQAGYRMHDLVRLVAEERLRDEEPAAATAAARQRLWQAWLGLAETADVQVTAGRTFVAGLRTAGTAPPLAASAVERDPLGWLDSWYVQLAHIVTDAAECLPDLAGMLAARLYGFLSIRRLADVRTRTLTTAVEATRLHSDLRARLLLQLANAHALAGASPTDYLHLRSEAAAAAEHSADRHLAVIAGERLAAAYHELTEYRASTDRLRALLPEARALDEQLYAQVLAMLGLALTDTGNYPEAEEQFLLALGIYTGDSRSAAGTLMNYAELLVVMGRPVDAEQRLREGLAISERLGDDALVAYLSLSLADALAHQQRFGEATAALRRAEATFHAAAEPTDLELAHLALWRARVESLRGEHATAINTLTWALSEFERLRNPGYADRTRVDLALSPTGGPATSGVRAAGGRRGQRTRRMISRDLVHLAGRPDAPGLTSPGRHRMHFRTHHEGARQGDGHRDGKRSTDRRDTATPQNPCRVVVAEILTTSGTSRPGTIPPRGGCGRILDRAVMPTVTISVPTATTTRKGPGQKPVVPDRARLHGVTAVATARRRGTGPWPRTPAAAAQKG